MGKFFTRVTTLAGFVLLSDVLAFGVSQLTGIPLLEAGYWVQQGISASIITMLIFKDNE
jgi:hypothetical protein